jgi:hypothetical protein
MHLRISDEVDAQSANLGCIPNGCHRRCPDEPFGSCADAEVDPCKRLGWSQTVLYKDIDADVKDPQMCAAYVSFFSTPSTLAAQGAYVSIITSGSV